MLTSKKLHSQPRRNTSTLDFVDSGGKFIIEEKTKREATRHITDAVLCTVSGIVMLGCYLVFILPRIALFRDNFGVSLAVVMVAITLSLYALATRGFKPQVGFDKVKKHFWICKLNARGHARIVTYVPRADVQSFFVRRPDAPYKDAHLCARIHGKLGPVTLLRGKLDDIEMAHQALCGQMRGQQIGKGVRPVLSGNVAATRLIPGLRVGSA